MRKFIWTMRTGLVAILSLIVLLGCLEGVSFAAKSKSGSKFVSRIGNKRKGLASISQKRGNFPKRKAPKRS